MSSSRQVASETSIEQLQHECGACRVFAVIVTYKQQPAQCPALQTLLASARTVTTADLDLRIIIWDNTPGGQEVKNLPDGVAYRSAPTNPGLVEAYNHVLELADAAGYDWLLTLDQDSSLPANFLQAITARTGELNEVADVGAIVPEVISDGHTMSPFYFSLGAFPRWFPHGFIGTYKTAVYAANSGAVLKVSALREFGGYDPVFPLDLSDTSLFHRLHASGKKVFVAGELTLQHNFALHQKEARMSLERYHASLLDDGAFWDMYMSPLGRLERIFRLTVRWLKDVLLSKDAAFRRRTYRELKRRLFMSRKARLAEWQAWTRDKIPRSLQA